MTGRIAIIGGDKRAAALAWPDGYDLRFYEYERNSAHETRRLIASYARGGVDFAILMAKWNGHAAQQTLRAAKVPFTIWGRGFGDLVKALPTIAGQYGITASENKVVETEMFETTETSIETPIDAQVETIQEAAVTQEVQTEEKKDAHAWTDDDEAALKLAAGDSEIDLVKIDAAFRDLLPACPRTFSAVKKKLVRMFPGRHFRKLTRAKYGSGAWATRVKKPKATRPRPHGSIEKRITQSFEHFKNVKPTSLEIACAIAMPTKLVSKALRRMHKTGDVVRASGSGTKEDPYRYEKAIKKAETAKVYSWKSPITMDIFQVLSDVFPSTLTSTGIAAKLGTTTKHVSDGLRLCERAGIVRVGGAGTKMSPYLYTVKGKAAVKIETASEWITSKEAGTILGCTADNVRQLARKGSIRRLNADSSDHSQVRYSLADCQARLQARKAPAVASAEAVVEAASVEEKPIETKSSGDHIVISLSQQAIGILNKLVALGIYGHDAADVAARFVDAALAQFIDVPKFKVE